MQNKKQSIKPPRDESIRRLVHRQPEAAAAAAAAAAACSRISAELFHTSVQTKAKICRYCGVLSTAPPQPPYVSERLKQACERPPPPTPPGDADSGLLINVWPPFWEWKQKEVSRRLLMQHRCNKYKRGGARVGRVGGGAA